MTKLAEVVKEYRIKKGVSQVVLAKHLGYGNPQYVSNWERGNCQVPMEKLKKIATFLKIKNEIILGAVMVDAKLEAIQYLKGA